MGILKSSLFFSHVAFNTIDHLVLEMLFVSTFTLFSFFSYISLLSLPTKLGTICDYTCCISMKLVHSAKCMKCKRTNL